MAYRALIIFNGTSLFFFNGTELLIHQRSPRAGADTYLKLTPPSSDWGEEGNPRPRVPPGATTCSGSSRGASTDPVVIPSGLPGTYGVLRPDRSDSLKNGRSRRPTVASKTHHRFSGPETAPAAWSWRMLATRLCAPRTTTTRMQHAFFPRTGLRDSQLGAELSLAPPPLRLRHFGCHGNGVKKRKETAVTTRDRLQGEGQRQGATEG